MDRLRGRLRRRTILRRTVSNTPGSTVTLENDLLRLSISTIGGASLTDIYIKSQSRSVLSTVTHASLYQLVGVTSAGALVEVDASAADTTTFLTAPDARTVVIESRHDQLGFVVTSTINLPTGSSEAAFSMEIARGRLSTIAGSLIGLVRYPGYALPMSASTKILVPVADGEVIETPLTSMATNKSRGYNYPGIASAQLMAIYDSVGGLVTYTRDSLGRFKTLRVRRIGNDVALFFEHILYYDTGPTIEVPYVTRLGSFDGGWERAADVYKAWAVTQSWCATRLESRTLPAQLTSPSFFLGSNIREAVTDDTYVDRTASIAAYSDSWSVGLGLPITNLLFSWEKNGPWITPDYFPAFPTSGSLTSLLTSLRAAGDQSALYLSGLNVTVAKTARNGAPDYAIPAGELAALTPSAIVDQNGAILSVGTAAGEGIGQHDVLCPSVAAARTVLSDAFSSCVGFGADLIQVDQIPGGGTPPCFATTHGHATGLSTTVYDSMSLLLSQLTTLALAATPQRAVSLEEPGELFIPKVDLFHCRDYAQDYYPRDGVGSLGVPLFSYLYHEYALGYGGDSAPLVTGTTNLSLALYAQAMNLWAGRFPGGAVWQTMVPFASLHATLKALIVNIAGLLGSAAWPYLRHGKAIDLRIVTGTQNLSGTYSGVPYNFDSPLLMSRGYDLVSGSRGLLYVNATDLSGTINLDFGPSPPSQTALSVWPTPGIPITNGNSYAMVPREIVFLITT